MRVVSMVSTWASCCLLLMAANGRLLGGLVEAVKVVCQALHGMDARVLDGTLCDLGYGGKRHTATFGDCQPCCRSGEQPGHDKIV